MNIFAIIAILIFSLVVSFYFLWRITTGQQDQLKDMLKVGIPLLIPLFALLIPFVLPQKATQIIVPELETKLEENKKLKQDIQSLNAIISEKEKDQKKANEKIKDLNQKNYAELSQASLVIDGLEKNGVKGSVALINNATYYGENILKAALDKEVEYDEDEKKIYIGSTGQQVTKTALSDSYNILYSGERFTSLNNYEEEAKVAGNLIENGFILDSSKYHDKGSFVLINTKNKYSSIEFDAGKLDSKSNNIEDGKLKIEVDGIKKEQETISSEIANKHYNFDISGATTLKISVLDSNSQFGFYNVVFNK
ncbi:hypothetical protein DOK67_0001518 [Enterococcus sp. DIV0212c]|uniref:hypothetical protein n=1 Tax=Enterococcus sp. DIV0212c TaxID=2230867 RepID=UPI001A9BD030|nr:hypothetical protein [Enterococcus sp. DIV0212c]MBO1354275.1 hypothetical protein [Enterococcus sp. DIV0212c]